MSKIKDDQYIILYYIILYYIILYYIILLIIRLHYDDNTYATLERKEY